ncbi:hypothetical protein [Empedobacter brevis]|uniref:hypothetical protein n=1 Tax=Empedobacter brevis TaxID=247 RepID=UPI00039A713B|nr:hypothetical protein [Empedobacter brevis]
MNDKRLNSFQRDRVLTFVQKEIDKDSSKLKTIEERLINLENISKNKKNIEESIVNNIETEDVFDIKYLSPVNTYKFLLNYNQNPILKSTCHDIDSNELENIRNYCGGKEYSFKNHLDKVVKEYSNFENQFAPPYLKALIRGYLTGLDFNGNIIENGWSSQNIKFNWSDKELLDWSENNLSVPPHLSDSLASQKRCLGFEFENAIPIYNSEEYLYTFKDLVLFFKKLFHVRADNSLFILIKEINKNFEGQIEFIINKESFPEFIEFFVDVDKFLQAYSKILEIILEVNQNIDTKPIVELSLEEQNHKIAFGILHRDSIYKKSLINTKQRLGDKYKNLIINQINGNCNLILEADFELNKSYRLGIWNKKNLWEKTFPEEEILDSEVGGVKHILEIIKS